MKLGNIHETVILIDTGYLNKKISDNLDFYRKLYPAKQFSPIKLEDLVTIFAENARISIPWQSIDVIFTYSLSYSLINFCTPSNLTFEIDGQNLKLSECEFHLKTFFSDEDESNTWHFINILTQLFSYKSVKKIILVADNSELSDEIELNEYTNFKDLFLIKDSDETHISLPINYVNIDYLIAYSLGLNRSEI